MTTIAMPPGFDDPADFSLEMFVNQRANGSPFGGSEQVIDLLNDRWTATVTSAPRTSDEAAAYEAFIASMRGLSNTVNLFHLVRPIPRGTMRGTPLTNPAAQGADEIILGTSAPGVTLLAGDMIGIDGLLLMVSEDCVSDGVGAMPVRFVNRLRRAIDFGVPVIWDRPKAPFRLASRSSVRHVPGWADGVAFDLIEAII